MHTAKSRTVNKTNSAHWEETEKKKKNQVRRSQTPSPEGFFALPSAFQSTRLKLIPSIQDCSQGRSFFILFSGMPRRHSVMMNICTIP